MILKECIQIRLQNTKLVEVHCIDSEIKEPNIDIYNGGFCIFQSNSNIGLSKARITKKNFLKYLISTAICNSNNFIDNGKLSKYINYFYNELEEFCVFRLNDKVPSEYIDFVNLLDKYIARQYHNILKKTIILKHIEDYKTTLIYNGQPDHSYINCIKIYFEFSINNIVGDYIKYGDVIFLNEKLEIIISSIDKIYSKIDEIYNNLVIKSYGTYIKDGSYECVLSSEVAGLLIHESIGHLSEADIVINGSILYNKYKERIVSSKITIVDYANIAFGRKCFIPLHKDDEGIECKDVKIIDKGILNSYLHNKETAYLLGMEPEGNARAATFLDNPIIRMRNICLLPGKENLNNIISNIKEGYYLIKAQNGSVDKQGNYFINIIFGYHIKEGKLYEPINNVIMYGNALECLNEVHMISKNVSWNIIECTKEQNILVSIGAPEICCNIKLKNNFNQ